MDNPSVPRPILRIVPAKTPEVSPFAGLPGLPPLPGLPVPAPSVGPLFHFLSGVPTQPNPIMISSAGSQMIKKNCVGCGKELILPPEEKWKSICKGCYKNGIRPVKAAPIIYEDGLECIDCGLKKIKKSENWRDRCGPCFGKYQRGGGGGFGPGGPPGFPPTLGGLS